MALVKQLADSIAAASEADAQDVPLLLHQILACGPATRTLAQEYGRELQKQGFIKDEPVEITDAAILSPERVQTLFAQGRGGMMLVTINGKTMQNETLLDCIAETLRDNTAVIVLTGAQNDIRDFLRLNRHIQVLMPNPVTAVPEQLAPEKRLTPLAAEWQAAKNADPEKADGAAVAPEKAGFAKKPVTGI